jgi:hypothetical protein
MQERDIEDHRPENKIETVFMNTYKFTSRGIVKNKEAELHGGRSC